MSSLIASLLNAFAAVVTLSRAARASARLTVCVTVAVASLGLLQGTAWAAPAPTTPPFTECQAVGYDHDGCALLIDVEGGGTSILEDPSQGAYDGSDDTLVGIVNNGLEPLSQISLSSATEDIMGFDGDGICENPNSTSGMPGLPASDCAGVNTVDTTGYGGPDSYFTNISPDQMSGTVNFITPIAPGGYTYFSLEAALTPVDLTPPTSLTTSLSGGMQSGAAITVPVGTAVTDSSTLSGANALGATGSVTYNVYSDSSCTLLVSSGTAEPITTFGTLPVSQPVTLNASGTYYWQAVYSGDATNGSSVSPCTPGGATNETETVTAMPLTASSAADNASVAVGEQDGFGVTITNPNGVAVQLTGITDTMPAGFSYVSGATTGATTSDPSANGQTLTWSGSLTVPAAGSISLHYEATPSMPGTSLSDSPGAVAGGGFSVTSGTVASVTATAAALLASSSADNPSVGVGGQDGFKVTVTNPNAVAVQLTGITDTMPAGFSYVSGSTTGATTSNPSANGQNLTWQGPFSLAAGGSVSLHYELTAPSAPQASLSDSPGGAAGGGFTVTPSGTAGSVAVTAAALTTSVSADASSVGVGAQGGYTVTINNPNAIAVPLSAVTDTVPAGFSYTSGSTTGATTSNPSVSGQTFTWSGSFSVPAGGSLSLHFKVTAPSAAQAVATDSAGGTAGNGFTVTPSGATAPVAVTAAALTTSVSADSSSVPTGANDGYKITITNPNAVAVSLTSITDTLAAGFSYVIGSTSGATTSDPTTSGQKLTWNGTFSVPGDGSVSLHFEVTVPSSAGGPFYDVAGGAAGGGFTVTPTGPTAPVTITSSGTTSTSCGAGQSCQSSLSTTVSAFQVSASSGSGGATLTESVNVGSALQCSAYKAIDPSWYGFSTSTTNRSKSLVYTVAGKFPALLFCFGAPYDFLTVLGTKAPAHALPDGSPGYVGLLAFCVGSYAGPCVSSEAISGSLSTGFKTTLKVQIPAGLAGDPWGRA